MAYIQLHQSLSHHRKTLRVAAVLKCDRHKVLGHLDELWWWGLDNANPQGLIGQVTPEDLADAAGWPVKDAARFVRALLDCGGEGKPGFLERSASGYVLHDWPDYAGKLNDQRELRKAANRQAQARRRQRLRSSPNDDMPLTSVLTGDDSEDDGHDDRSSDNYDSQHPNVPDRTGPNRTGPDPSPLPPSATAAEGGDAPPNGAFHDDETNGGTLSTPRRPRRDESPPEPACCPNFANTGSEHWQFCPNAVASEVQV